MERTQAERLRTGVVTALRLGRRTAVRTISHCPNAAIENHQGLASDTSQRRRTSFCFHHDRDFRNQRLQQGSNLYLTA